VLGGKENTSHVGSDIWGCLTRKRANAQGGRTVFEGKQKERCSFKKSLYSYRTGKKRGELLGTRSDGKRGRPNNFYLESDYRRRTNSAIPRGEGDTSPPNSEYTKTARSGKNLKKSQSRLQLSMGREGKKDTGKTFECRRERP